MSKPKVWTLPVLLDRIWMLSRGKRTAVRVTEQGRDVPYTAIKRVVTGWDEDYRPRTYELNKISAASAAALYERIKTMRAKGRIEREKNAEDIFQAGYERGRAEFLEAQERVAAISAMQAASYKKQIDEWSDEVQRRGGI